MKKVLCIGQVAYDITLLVDKYPLENKKMRTNGKVECAGGSAFNSAYLLASWGIDTTFIGSIGKDEMGEKIKKEAQEIGLKTKLCEKDTYTTSSYIITNTESGTRTILTNKNKELKYVGDLPNEEYDMLVLDSNEFELSLKLLEKYPNAISVLDAGKYSEEVMILGKKVNYFVCSRDFAEGFIGKNLTEENIEEAYQKIKEEFKNEVVITFEEKGSYREGKMIPSISVKALDSTGAGDIFHGAFTYFIANNYSFYDALRLANIAGALSVRKIGSKNSMPSLEEVLDYHAL